MKRLLPFVWLAVAAGLTCLANLNEPISLAAWLGPVFLLRFVRESRLLVGAGVGLLAQTAAMFLAFRTMIPLPAAPLLGLLLLTGSLALLPYFADRSLRKRLSCSVASLLLPAGAVCMEFAKGWLGDGVPTWGSPAYTQQGVPALLQLVSVTGTWGLIFLLHWLAPVVNNLWDEGISSPGARRAALLFAGVMTLVAAGGEARLKLAPVANTVRVAGVVPVPGLDWLSSPEMALPLGEAEKIRTNPEQYRPGARKIQDHLFEATEREARSGAQVVAWSEMAAWVFSDDEPALLGRASEIAKRWNIHLLIGVATLPLKGEKLVDNRAILFDPSGATAWSYRKTHLVPGSEEKLSLAGDGQPKVASTGVGRLVGAVCYDMDFPATIRRLAADADILFAPSHDYQAIREVHARMAVLRAIENGVAMVRPTANGAGIATDAYGRTLAWVGYQRSGGASLVAQVPQHGVRTVYSRWGDWFAWLCTMALGALLLIARRDPG